MSRKQPLMNADTSADTVDLDGDTGRALPKYGYYA